MDWWPCMTLRWWLWMEVKSLPSFRTWTCSACNEIPQIFGRIIFIEVSILLFRTDLHIYSQSSRIHTLPTIFWPSDSFLLVRWRQSRVIRGESTKNWARVSHEEAYKNKGKGVLKERYYHPLQSWVRKYSLEYLLKYQQKSVLAKP